MQLDGHSQAWQAGGSCEGERVLAQQLWHRCTLSMLISVCMEELRRMLKFRTAHRQSKAVAAAVILHYF